MPGRVDQGCYYRSLLAQLCKLGLSPGGRPIYGIRSLTTRTQQGVPAVH